MEPQLEGLRLVTVHPALVHLSLGPLPLLLLAYGLAALRRSDRWTFVGDAAAAVTAVLTLATAGSGLLANTLVSWPGGMGPWRWIHLGFGAGATALLAAFAIARLLARRRAPGRPAGPRAALAAAAIAALFAFTGWVGGEVLVFHAGMAVKGAAGGALAPGLRPAPDTPPADLREAMHRIRADFATVSTLLAAGIVQRPAEADFDVVAAAAGRMAELGDHLTRTGATGGHAGHGHADQPDSLALASMAEGLRDRARSLEAAARRRSLASTARALGALAADCAGCHQSFRWRAPGEPTAVAATSPR